MAKRVSIADRLKELGHDPVLNLVRIATTAESAGNLALAAKANAELLEYCAPKLKAVEHDISDDLKDLLVTPEQRRARIRELASQVGMLPRPAIEGTVVPITQKEITQ